MLSLGIFARVGSHVARPFLARHPSPLRSPLIVPLIVSLPLHARGTANSAFAQKESVRKYPIGISDYKKIVLDGYFHWDRTLFLKEFYDDTVLILRPRRWAKTTTVSMAKYFFDINASDLAHSLFSHSKLSQEDHQFVISHCGQFPVISVTFGECRASSWVKMERWLSKIISRVYNDHLYLFKADGFLEEHERRKFQAILDEDPSAFCESALVELTALLHRYHKKRVIVLIDEYDNPVNEAFENKYFKEAIAFLMSAFTGCLKDNPNLEKGLLTGVLRVAKAGYLSDLNNLSVYSLLDPEYADKYGVTESEMQEALRFEGLSSQSDAVRDFYDGYDTALPDFRLYNPWSSLNFLAKKRIASYWIETGKTDFIAQAMWSGPTETRETVLQLLKGEECDVPIDVDLDFQLLETEEGLWSLLFFSGYLTGTRKGNSHFQARVPNAEVMRELRVMWERFFRIKGVQGSFKKCTEALLKGDGATFQKEFSNIIKRLISRDPEAFYHASLLIMLYPLLDIDYLIESNREHGFGRPDIVIRPPEGKPPVIIELKMLPLKDRYDQHPDERLRDLQVSAEEAVQQIHQKEYSCAFPLDTPSAIFCGVACLTKYVAVKMEVVDIASIRLPSSDLGEN